MPTENKKGHFNQRLSGVAYAFKQDEFVGQMLMPEVPVTHGSDDYTIFEKGNMFKQPSDVMGKRSRSNRVTANDSFDTFVTKPRALHEDVPMADIMEADDPLQPRVTATEVITAALLLKREIRIHDLAATLTGASTTTPTTKWDLASSDPITDIETAIHAMFRRANTMVIGRLAWDVLRFHPAVLSAIGGGFIGNKKVTTEMIGDLFDVSNVAIGEARKDTAKSPNTPSLSRVWVDEIFLAHVDPRTQGRDIMTFGTVFARKLRSGMTFNTRTWTDPSIGIEGAEIIQVEHDSVEKIVASEFGHFLSDVRSDV